MKRFWNWTDEGNELRLTGAIASDNWYGDEVTPKLFRDELDKHPGDVTVYINSPDPARKQEEERLRSRLLGRRN